MGFQGDYGKKKSWLFLQMALKHLNSDGVKDDLHHIFVFMESIACLAYAW